MNDNGEPFNGSYIISRLKIIAYYEGGSKSNNIFACKRFIYKNRLNQFWNLKTTMFPLFYDIIAKNYSNIYFSMMGVFQYAVCKIVGQGFQVLEERFR